MSDISSPKPDLDENASVLENAAAVSREKVIYNDGAKPVALWVMLIIGLVVLIAGGALFKGDLFDYNELTADGYVRLDAPADGSVGTLPEPALKAHMKVGGKLAKASCLSCHGNNGEGTADVPPLANSEWVTGSSLRPALIILNGCKGPIDVAGKSYNGNMPAQGSGLGPKELAGILNFIRNSFGNEADLITLDMAQNALDVSKERNGGQMTAEELNASYDKDLEGDALAPDALVDPITLVPVAVAE